MLLVRMLQSMHHSSTLDASHVSIMNLWMDVARIVNRPITTRSHLELPKITLSPEA